MTPTPITALLVSTDLRARRDGTVGVDVTPAGSTPGGHRARRESPTHQYSLPVVREMPPRSIGSHATW